MGIEIAESLISQNHYCPEQRLWRHVLLNAVEDTRILQSDRKSSIHKMEAHQWITKENQDFNWICWQSGWDPEIVKEQYFRAVREGHITFTHRQLKWIEYYRLYLDLKKEANGDKRKVLRKKVEKLRKQVLATTTAVVKNLISTPNLLPCV